MDIPRAPLQATTDESQVSSSFRTRARTLTADVQGFLLMRSASPKSKTYRVPHGWSLRLSRANILQGWTLYASVAAFGFIGHVQF